MRKKSVNLENFKVLVAQLPQPWLQLQPVRPSWILPLRCPYTCHCKTPCVPKQFNIFMYDCSWDALLWRNYEYNIDVSNFWANANSFFRHTLVNCSSNDLYDIIVPPWGKSPHRLNVQIPFPPSFQCENVSPQICTYRSLVKEH